MSFAVSVFFYLLCKRMASDDRVLVTSPPVFTALSVYAVSRLKKTLRYVLDVRDLWPQGLIAHEYVRASSLSYRCLLSLVEKSCRGADRTVSVSEGISEYLEGVVGAGRVSLIHNPVDTDFFRPMPAEEMVRFRADHSDMFGSGDRTVFVFAGTLGAHIGMRTVMEALEQVACETRAFSFILIGQGEEEAAIRAFVHEHGSKPTCFFCLFMERRDLVRFIGAADFCIASLRSPRLSYAIPTKILEYLACGKFVLAALDGPFAKLLAEADVALVSPTGDARALAGNLAEFIRRTDHYSAKLSPGRSSSVSFPWRSSKKEFVICLRATSPCPNGRHATTAVNQQGRPHEFFPARQNTQPFSCLRRACHRAGGNRRGGRNHAQRLDWHRPAGCAVRGRLSAFKGAAYAVAVNSCTAALHLSLVAADLRRVTRL